MTPQDELFDIAQKNERLAAAYEEPNISIPLATLDNAIDMVANAFSGSWLGYHANVYYDGMQQPPPGFHFSSEWGLMPGMMEHGTNGPWREYDPRQVEQWITARVNREDLRAVESFAARAARESEKDRVEAVSILSVQLELYPRDGFLQGLKDKIDKMTASSYSDVLAFAKPKGQKISRDSIAIGAGFKTPPHIDEWIKLYLLKQPKAICIQLGAAARQAGSHIARKSAQQRKAILIGTNVFIGHGRSLLWRELKDFVEEKLHQPVDEFNRVPVAGVTNIARLSEMLEASAMAFLIMTGEDGSADGTLRARMNVVHEAGLFQGRLGFSKAIVLLEEGCEEFSNIQGLGQIRFPKGNIKAAFQEIREVLQREGLIPE